MDDALGRNVVETSYHAFKTRMVAMFFVVVFLFGEHACCKLNIADTFWFGVRACVRTCVRIVLVRVVTS